MTLTASVVNAGPNIDLSAELYSARRRADRIQQSRHAGQCHGDGDWSRRVNTRAPHHGVGRGDPLTDGYSDYGSMGAFLVSGTVAGGVKPARFTVNEKQCERRGGRHRAATRCARR